MKTTLTTTILLFIMKFCFAQDFWMQLEVPENFVGRSMDANSLGWLFVGTNDGVYRSTENGLNLSKIGLENVVLGLTVDVQDNIFAGSGPINLSSDNGEVWSEINTPSDVNIIYTNVGLILYGNWGEIYKSSDLGETWVQALELDNTQVINAIAESSDGVLFAGITSYFGGGGVYHSLDNGDTWQQVGLNNKFISSLAISSTGVLFAGSRGDYEYGGGGVFRSEDNGITWEEVAYNVWVTSMAIDPNDVLYIGCTREHGGPGGVYRTKDNGDSWDHIITGMSDYHLTVEGLSLSPDGYLYAYSRWVLYRSTQPVFSSNSIIQQETIELKIYPNPFSDILHIELPNEQPLHGSLSVRVIDPLGRVVYSNSLCNLKGFTVNLSTLSAGFYYISIEGNRQKYSKPIIKVLR